MTITQSSTRFIALTLGVAIAAVSFFAVLATPAHAASCPALTRSLQVGSNGADVKALQMFLNSNASTQIAASGAGSPGSETTYFGGLTKAAAIKFQAANGVSPIGIVGPATRAAIAAVCSGSTGGNTGGNTGGTVGGSVTVSAAAQPVNSLAVAGASRVPFTTFTLTNNSSSAVTVNSVTVQRTGLGVDSNFSGVVLLDANGLQIGNSKTFNSNHQANIADSGFTLAAGSSMTFTVAGNIASASTAQSGQVVSLAVVAINSSATVSGSLPITGASQTINTTLTLGSVSTTTSSVVPPTSTSHSQNIGDVGVRFAGLKFTAGSAEAIKLYSIRWRQIGSGSSVDISNVVTVAGGTSYPTTVDSSGKYYTTVFPGGIFIDKGNSLDVYTQGDLTGTNSAGRTIQFTIDRVTDVYFVGQVYGYGVSPSGTSQPWFTGDSFSIQAGTASTISKSNASADAAQNIAVNVPNQPLGGFTTNFLGEPVSVSGMTVTVATSSGVTSPLTNVSIVDQNGTVVAGPVDGSTLNSTLTFSDTVTFPTGMHTYHLRGKVPSGTTNNSTVTLTVTPSGWTNPTGQISGNSVSLSGNGAFALNQMTIQAATTSITVSNTPTTQNVVAGTQGFTFANIQLDASQSGEDIRFSSLPVNFVGTGTTPASYLSGCQLFDGATALTTGSRVVNSLTSGSSATFSFDNSLVVPKGTVKTLSVVCNISSSANSDNTYKFGIRSSDSFSASGITSGVSITPSIANATSYGGIMSVSSGSATVAVDSSSPAYALKAAGSTGVTATVLKFHASNEALNLTKIGLTLTNSGNSKSQGAAANSGTNGGSSDIVQAYIYNGSTLVGTAFFTGTNTTATSTLSTPVALAKDADTLLTVKLDLAQISVSAAGGIGDVVKVDPLNFEASGASSGSTIKGPTTSNTVTTGAAGIQMFKSYPTLATGPATATNPNGSAQALKKFSVTANAGGSIGLYQVAVSIATSSATVRNLKLFAFTDASYSSPANVPNTTAGQFGGTAALSAATDIAAPTVSFYQGTPLQVSAGQTMYFTLVGDVAPVGSATNWTITSTILGDSATTTALANYNVNAVAALISHTGSITGVATSTSASNFIWADNATTTAATTDVDWANGFNVPGLSSSGF